MTNQYEAKGYKWTVSVRVIAGQQVFLHHARMGDTGFHKVSANLRCGTELAECIGETKRQAFDRALLTAGAAL